MPNSAARSAWHGSSDKPVVQGGFEMRRGTLDVIGKRLTFTRGRVTFPDGLDPELDFIAEAPASDITARVLLSGRQSNPKIDFSSTPELPRDEVPSRILFGKASGKLSAAQTIQLAQALAQLTGATGKGLDDLRKSLGVDSLDVATDDTGKGVAAGVNRRINDNISVGVQQGATSNSSKVTVDIDVLKGVKVQGAAGADGKTSVGVGYEYEY